MSIEEPEAPQFAVLFRGYDRRQVNEYFAWLGEYVAHLKDRVVAAETALLRCQRELVSPGTADISPRLGTILELANQEADEIRARARSQGEALTAQAARNAEALVTEANVRRDAIQVDIEDLASVREELLEGLVEFGGHIGDAMARYQQYRPLPTARPHVDIELAEAEAREREEVVHADAQTQIEMPTAAADTSARSDAPRFPKV